MLGVPSVYLNDAYIYYTRHLENDYRLMFNLTTSEQDQEKAIRTAVRLLEDPDTPKIWAERRDAMLRTRIDVTDFLVRLVENYPGSKKNL